MSQESYVLPVYKFENPNSVLKHKPNPTFSSGIAYPKFSYGFQHFHHQSKEKMWITNQFEGKKKVYKVFNEFELNIDEYDKDLTNEAKKFFKNKPTVVGPDFYKLWELLTYFDLVNPSKKGLTTAHIGEDVGGFAQATLYFRDHMGSGSTDKSYVVPQDSKSMVFKDKRVNLKGLPKGGVDFVTCTDGNRLDVKGVDEDTYKHIVDLQEQNIFKVLLDEVLTTLKIQAKGGSAVIRFYETFTEPTVKLISILPEFYKSVYITKPFTSDQADSEKFIVCLGYKGGNYKPLEDLVKNIKTGKEVVDIFSSFKIAGQTKAFFVRMNTNMSNTQFERVNNIVDFINKENYRGEEYQDRRQAQIDGSTFWVNSFFLDKKNLSKKRDEWKKIIDTEIKYNTNSVTKLLAKLDD